MKDLSVATQVKTRNSLESPSAERMRKTIMFAGIGAFGCGFLLFLGVLGLVLIVWIKSRPAGPDRQGPFQAQMGEYTKQWGQTPAPKNAKPVGKWVVVDMENKELDELHLKLPDDLRATDPDEVRTIVQVSRSSHDSEVINVSRRDKLEYRQHGGKVHINALHVRLIDPASGGLIFEKEFDGSDVQFGSGSSGGMPNNDKILAYLLALKR